DIEATATQARLYVRGADGECTVNLREGSEAGPDHPDATNSPDTSRPDTIIWQDGTRVITVGHERGNLVLYADTDYFVSACGTTRQFRTALPTMGSTQARPYPWSATSYDRHDNPTIDWSPSAFDKTYPDPVTGIRYKVLNRTGEWSFQGGPNRFWTRSGGVGWTNPANLIATDAALVASVGTTNPIDVYVPGLERAGEQLGIITYGGITGTNLTNQDREINYCIVTDPAAGCVGTPVKLLLPVRPTNGIVTTGNSDNTVPTNFPAYSSGPYGGWNTSLRANQHSYYIVPGLNAAAGMLTVNSPALTSANGPRYFVPLKPGHRVWVKDATNCENFGVTFVGTSGGLCTVETYFSAARLKLVQSITNATQEVLTFPYSIRVWKTNNVGVARLNLKYKWAGNFGSNVFAESASCHPASMPDANGNSGRLCNIPTETSTQRIWIWVPDDPNMPALWAGMLLNTNSVDNPGNPAGDRLFVNYQIPSGPFSFDNNDGTSVYFGGLANSAKPSLFRVRFNASQFTAVPRPAYRANSGGSIGYYNEGYTFTNMTPTSGGKDIATQVLAKYPGWNQTLYPLNNIEFNGIVDQNAYFTIQYNAKDIGPCFMVTVNLTTGTLLDVAHSLDSSESSTPGFRYSTCHNIGGNYPSFNALPRASATGNPAYSFTGPFRAKADAVMRSGVWSSNTALPFSANGSYDSQCPTGLTDEQRDNLQIPANPPPSTLYGSCVTLRFPGHPCNATPSPRETPANGVPVCTWNSAYTQPTTWKVGDRFIDDYSVGSTVNLFPASAQQRSSEYFRVLAVSTEPDGKIKIVAQRDSVWDYCCSARKGGRCVIGDLQVSHATGWFAQMAPGTRNSCIGDGGFAVWNRQTGSATYFPVSYSFGGHFAIGKGIDSPLSFLSGQISIPNINSIGDLAQKAPVSGLPTRGPVFAGVASPIGSTTQQYLSRNHIAAPRSEQRWSMDSNALLPSDGNNTSLGLRTITNISGSVWRIDVLGGAVNYKVQPLLGWSGGKVLKDVSGVSSQLASAEDYTLCYALRAGECVAGSTAGQTFVKVPYVYQTGTCEVSKAFWAEMPCVFSGTPGAGTIRQFFTDRAEVDSRNQRIVSTALSAPGTVPHYWQARLHPSGRSFIVPSSKPLDGVRSAYLLGILPPIKETSGRTTFGGLSVRVPASPGATHARIKFGYNPSGTSAVALKCTERNEACITDTVIAPFAFAGDSGLSPTPCSSGCTINVPAVPGRLTYWKIEWLEGGSVVQSEDIHASVP
ncbi:MAG: hypothetical protein H7039_18785, partial [Bryobacteraceae bacterium]|nr:hypothetical protein [Bryobacteraceae bacterium]